VGNFRFEELKIWQQSIELADELFEIADKASAPCQLKYKLN